MYFKDPAAFFELVTDQRVVLHAVNVINDGVVAVSHSMHEEFIDVMSNTNAVLAAFTTSQARLHLYSFIENLGPRLLYFDTDSIIYTSTVGKQEYQVPIGSYLGMMTDELRDYGPGSYIVEFVSGGPKNYSFKVYSTKYDKFFYVTKIRGFSLTSTASKRLNFNSIKKFVFEYVKSNVTCESNLVFQRIERRKNRDIVTKTICKKYKIVYTKRVLRRDFTTVPYDYKQ